MDDDNMQIKIKRTPYRKRSRGGARSFLTPAKKKYNIDSKPKCEGKEDREVMANSNYECPSGCSDSEDLFGDYDSILEDCSFMAKLNDVEQQEHCNGTATQQSEFTALKRSEDTNITFERYDKVLHDPDESFEDLPSSQLLFQAEVQRASQLGTKNDAVPEDHKAPNECTGTKGKHPVCAVKSRTSGGAGRRSVTEQLKRAMQENAAAAMPSVSRAARQKEAVVLQEMSVALLDIESGSSHIDLGPFFGLPTKVKDLIANLRGIKDLYEWQKTCLTLDSVLQHKNLIYSLPTSGGKTLVAEILILKELLCRKMNAMLIVPYISLVQEKVRGLASFGLELDFLVEEYAGSKGRFPPVKRRTRNSLYVATIEKAHSLVNSLVEAGRMESLGLIVVDELHMLGDGSRGAILEMTLAKVLYVSRSTQIIGMSATLSNVRDLQKFLSADNYTSDFRPVQLNEYLKVKDNVYEVHPAEDECTRFSRTLNFKYSNNMQKIDPDHIIALVTEVIPMHSCLVFCPSKKNCENVGLMICKYLKKDFLQHREAEKSVLLQELQNSGAGSLCPVLQITVPFGLAYHHSGLTADERRLVEEAYSAGVLCLLTCTSTLAAGINLPARRVILRSPYVGAEFLKRSQYKQMVGRAGRAGIDTQGESILILQDKDMLRVKELVSSPMERCHSQLLYDNSKGIHSLILSLIGLKITQTQDQIRDFVAGTLLSIQQSDAALERSLWDVVQDTIKFLIQKCLICDTEDSEGTTTLQVTNLGKAAYKGSIDLLYCDVLYKDLSRGLDSLMLNSFLHLIYLVTPYEMVSQCKPDWMVLFRQFSLLSASEQKMAAAVGVPESFVARKAAGQSVRKPVDALVVGRLYLALVLLALLRETNLWIVAERFQLTRGFVQSLLSSASAFCSCVLHFTEELDEFWPYKGLLAELTRRLTYCVKMELIPLMEVAGVQEARAKQLFGAGYKSLSHLANADPNLLVISIQNLSKRQANQIVASAKMLLLEKAEALKEEVNDLLSLPVDLPTL